MAWSFDLMIFRWECWSHDSLKCNNPMKCVNGILLAICKKNAFQTHQQVTGFNTFKQNALLSVYLFKYGGCWPSLTNFKVSSLTCSRVFTRLSFHLKVATGDCHVNSVGSKRQHLPRQLSWGDEERHKIPVTNNSTAKSNTFLCEFVWYFHWPKLSTSCFR